MLKMHAKNLRMFSKSLNFCSFQKTVFILGYKKRNQRYIYHASETVQWLSGTLNRKKPQQFCSNASTIWKASGYKDYKSNIKVFLLLLA